MAEQFEAYQVTAGELEDLVAEGDIRHRSVIVDAIKERKGLTPAQQRMKTDLEARVDQLVETARKRVAAGADLDSLRGVAAQGVAKLSDVLTETVGKASHADSTLSAFGQFQRDVPNIAHEVINTEPLELSLAEWQVVQRLVEKALVRGYNEHV